MRRLFRGRRLGTALLEPVREWLRELPGLGEFMTARRTVGKAVEKS